MKQILIFLFAFVAFNLNAQYRYEFQTETPDTSAASATHYIYPSGTSFTTETGFDRSGELDIIVRVDSLSGATAGTVTIEFTDVETGAVVWPYGTTLTVNGPLPLYLNYDDDNFSHYKWRVKIVNTGATQSNRMAVSWAYKRKSGS